MAGEGLANYTLYEDDGTTFAYQNGHFAQTSVNCRVNGDIAVIEVEEQFSTYRPAREWYEIIVFAGGRVLKQRVKAGQGKIRVQLSS